MAPLPACRAGLRRADLSGREPRSRGQQERADEGALAAIGRRGEQPQPGRHDPAPRARRPARFAAVRAHDRRPRLSIRRRCERRGAETEPGPPIHPPPAVIPTDPFAARPEPPLHSVALQELLRSPSSLAGVRSEPDTRRRHLLLGLGLAIVAAAGTAWWLASRRGRNAAHGCAPSPCCPSGRSSKFGRSRAGIRHVRYAYHSSEQLAWPGRATFQLGAHLHRAQTRIPLQAGRDLRVGVGARGPHPDAGESRARNARGCSTSRAGRRFGAAASRSRSISSSPPRTPSPG